jgi:hypothetical protein
VDLCKQLLVGSKILLSGISDVQETLYGKRKPTKMAGERSVLVKQLMNIEPKIQEVNNFRQLQLNDLGELKWVSK